MERSEPEESVREPGTHAASPEADDLYGRAGEASEFLKALAHEARLLILCHLVEGERSVSELEGLVARRQASVSQQLARLRLEGFVKARRDGKAVYYSLADDRIKTMVTMIHHLFCGTPGSG